MSRKLSVQVFVCVFAHSFSGLGYETPCGTVDFYPNGGRRQPGCNRNFFGRLMQLLRGKSKAAFGGEPLEWPTVGGPCHNSRLTAAKRRYKSVHFAAATLLKKWKQFCSRKIYFAATKLPPVFATTLTFEAVKEQTRRLI